MKKLKDTNFKPAPEKKSSKRIDPITFTSINTGTPFAIPSSREMAEPYNKRK